MAFFFSSNPLPFLLLLLLSAAAASSAGDHNATATFPEVLAFFNMPAGLFPDNVTSFSLDGSTGAFRANISGGPCYLPPEGEFYFYPFITGRLEYNFISHLSGIQTPRYWYFSWYDIEFIQVDLYPGSYIHFETYAFTTTCPIAQFSTVRTCEPHVPSAPQIFQSFRSTKDFFSNLFW